MLSFLFSQMSRVGSRGRHPKCRPKNWNFQFTFNFLFSVKTLLLSQLYVNINAVTNLGGTLNFSESKYGVTSLLSSNTKSLFTFISSHSGNHKKCQLLIFHFFQNVFIVSDNYFLKWMWNLSSSTSKT